MSLAEDVHIVDYVVFCVALFASLSVGIYYAYKERRHKTIVRYHRADGKLNALPVAVSLLVTYESSIFFLGYPAEVYIHGFVYVWYNVGIFLSYSCMFLVAIPLFHPLNVTSVFEYIQMRHGSLPIRQMATALSTLFMSLYAGIVVFGAAIAFESVTHITTWISIIAMVSFAVLYTSLGGLKAVVATDIVQCIIMIVTIFAILICGTVSVGGLGNVIALNEPTGRLNLAVFDPNPLERHTFWTLVVGGAVSSFGINFKQPVVQRLNSTKSIAEARKVLFIAIPLFVILQLLVMTEGLVAYAYFSHKGCDPLASGDISNPNQMIPYIVQEMFHSTPGVTGLFLASLCCASLSTVSSLLSSVSAIVSEDIVKPYWKEFSDEKLTNISKIIVVFCGLFCIGVSIMISQLKGPLTQIAGSVLSAIDGPMIAIFIMSIFVTFTTRKGLVTGMICGIAFAVWLSSGYNFSPGRKQTPLLQPGPISKCVNKTLGSLPVEYIFQNDTLQTPTNSSLMEINSTFKYTFDNGNLTQSVPEVGSLHGLDYLYSISYLYFSPMVIFVSVCIGLAVSKVTKPDRESPVPPNLTLSIRKQPSCCLPEWDKISCVWKTPTAASDNFDLNSLPY